MIRPLIILIIFLVSGISEAQSITLSELKAFPTAIGFGQNATGGRGGTIYEVTNLNNSGIGSLRDAISQGNRTVVFKVSGIITLSGVMYFGGSNITIAGETAPGQGIAVYGSMTDTNGHENIVVRNVSFLAGDPARVGDDDSFRIRHLGTGAKSNFIFDHCDFLWGKDENIAIEAVSDETGSIEKVTVQRSIIGESFNSKGMLIWRQGFDVSIINNLLSNNFERNIRASTRYASWEQINNVIYNYYTGVNPSWSNVFDVIGNVFMNKQSALTDIRFELAANEPAGVRDDTRAYISDNTRDGGPADSNVTGIPLKETRQVSSGYVPLANTGTVVMDNVLTDVGNNVNGNNTVALRQINSVINNTGVFTSTEAGSIPLVITGSIPYVDTNSDGIADDWASVHGIASSAQIKEVYSISGKTIVNNAGYSALEIFLADMAGDFDRLPLDDGPGPDPQPQPGTGKRINRNILLTLD